MFAEVVRNLKTGKAPGELSGTYEMLQAAAFGSTAGLQKCCAFVNASLTHPRAATYVTDAANIPGSAAAKRDALKYLSWVAAAHGPAVTKGSFLAGAHRELSVALIKCQGSVYRGCADLLARAAGRRVLPGAEVPYVD